MALPTAPNSISANQINVELGKLSTIAFSTNETNFREMCSPADLIGPTLPPFGNATQISYDDARGKTKPFYLTISSNVTNGYDVRANAVAAGWDQVGRVIVTVNSGVSVRNSSGWAMTVSGSFPNGVRIVNNGFIVGQGGNGGTGGGGTTVSVAGQSGLAGGNGGNGLLVQTECVIQNNSGAIIGAGGGGGGGGGGAYATYSGTFSRAGGSGGAGGAGGGLGGATGGGRVFGANTNGTGTNATVGANGGITTRGTASTTTPTLVAQYIPQGIGIYVGDLGRGGNGGNLGQSGVSGVTVLSASGVGTKYIGNGGSGGSAGIAINGINRIVFWTQGVISGITQNN